MKDAERTRAQLREMEQKERSSMLSDENLEGVEVKILLHLPQVSAFYVTEELKNLDRELRRRASARSAGELGDLWEAVSPALQEGVWSRPTRAVEEAQYSSQMTNPRLLQDLRKGAYPASPASASLAIVGAGKGSTNLVLEAIGGMVAIMASAPMTAIVNAAAWSGPVRQVRAWFRRRGDVMERVSARDALLIFEELNDVRGRFGSPDGEVIINELDLPDGTRIRGRSITTITRHPDGTETYIQVQ